MSTLFSWLWQGHSIFSGPVFPHGTLAVFVHASECSFSLGHRSTSSYVSPPPRCPLPSIPPATSYTLVMLHADTRMSKLICLGPPPPQNPKYRVKWLFSKGPPLWDFLSRKTVLIRSPTCRKPKGQEGWLACLRDGQLPHSYSPHRLIALQFFQLLCLKGSETVLLSPASFVPQPLSYLL